MSNLRHDLLSRQALRKLNFSKKVDKYCQHTLHKLRNDKNDLTNNHSQVSQPIPSRKKLTNPFKRNRLIINSSIDSDDVFHSPRHTKGSIENVKKITFAAFEFQLHAWSKMPLFRNHSNKTGVEIGDLALWKNCICICIICLLCKQKKKMLKKTPCRLQSRTMLSNYTKKKIIVFSLGTK